MICSQPPVHQSTPQRALVFRGSLDLQTTIEKFGRHMPKLSEFDELVRHNSTHPELVSKRRALPARSGTIVAYPAENTSFPRFLEFVDVNTKRKICLDTKHYMNQRHIALVLELDTYAFRFDGNRLLLLPSKDPIVIPDFPQRPGWYPYHKDTGIPVVSGGIVDPSGHRPERFLQRVQDCWIGMPSRSINEGNYEEKYVHLFAQPSVPQAVFIWETRSVQAPEAGKDEERKVPRRRIIAVPASLPDKNEAKPLPSKPPITYQEFLREWNEHRLRSFIDPEHYSDPGDAPNEKTFDRLLKEGKIRVEK